MVTLDRLVNVLGGYGVALRDCTIPHATDLRSVVMHEPAADRTVVGDVLLAIGAGSIGRRTTTAGDDDRTRHGHGAHRPLRRDG